MSPTDERIVDLIAGDEEVQRRAQAARELEQLKDSGAWLYLSKRFEKYPDKVAGVIARRLLRGDRIPQDEIDFARGYAVAIADIFTTPERVSEELENAAEKAYRRIQEEGEVATGDDAPYK